MFKQLSNILSASSDKDVDKLLEQLLGPEEKIMLAKRLAIVIMIEQGYSYNQIANKLHISTSTASNIAWKLNTTGVDSVIGVVKKNDQGYKELLSIIEKVLSLGDLIPSKAGLDRYRSIKR